MYEATRQDLPQQRFLGRRVLSRQLPDEIDDSGLAYVLIEEVLDHGGDC